MIQSMTGFGKCERYTEYGTLTVDLRSVNNRYCDVSVKLPEFLEVFSEKLKRQVCEKMVRGRVMVSVTLNGVSDKIDRLKLNLPVIRHFFNSLTQMAKELGIDEKVKIEHLLTLSTLFDVETPSLEAEKVIKLIQEMLGQAIEECQKMRRYEGEFLQKEILEHLSVIIRYLAETEQIHDEMKAGYFEKLKKNLKTICLEVDFDDNRVLQEAAIMAKRIDITEECERLRSHIDQFQKYMSSDEPAGKKMTFLLQEMSREVSTIGSKAENARISQLVVLMKDELEKVREQAQNIL